MGSSTVVPGIPDLEATHPWSGGPSGPPRLRDQRVLFYSRNAYCFGRRLSRRRLLNNAEQCAMFTCDQCEIVWDSFNIAVISDGN
ncbi:unnamed protein product [Cyprideis torosa]|uniref:Uncharacterized protein n=1 Tax=Cyprideis torosa TaxID=163714 RepID=A0A7R8WLU8_9CRUS|nr:unnamed protein product [Cyprideis torosa]CAG0904735.1 unnamed protein product [Cyprideis torosa]